MDWARAKTILIFVLLFVDAILAGILVYRSREAGGAQSRKLAEAVAVLERAGYELVPEQLPNVSAPILDLLRDADAEQAAAAYLFGSPAKAVPLGEGGASVRYVCPAGEAVFRTGGSFELKPYQPLEAGEIPENLAEWLRGMGFLSGSVSPDVADSVDGIHIQVWRNDFRSWGEEAAAVVAEGKIVSISGRWQLGQAKNSVSAGTSGSAASALLSLAGYLRESGMIPGKLLDIELGYSLEVLSSDVTRFIPCWRVGLQSGAYYVNALTGDTETAR